MKNKGTFQEILLFTDTAFAAKEWALKNGKENKLTQKQKLEDACWSGMIPEILPEISEVAYDRKLILWQVNAANSFLDLRFSYQPEVVESETSINPYMFLETMIEN